MSRYAENPVYGARQYEILVAQKAEPRIEVQSLDDAAHVLDFTEWAGVGALPAHVPVYPSVEETLVHAAREAMLDDEQRRTFQAHPGASVFREITDDEYWAEVAQLARGYKTLGGRPRGEPSSWYLYLFYSPPARGSSRLPPSVHPMLFGFRRQLDVLRHTAHPDEVDRHMGWGGVAPIMTYLADAAAYAMAADVAEQAAGSILYRPNPGACTTSEQGHEYPCGLRQLEEFADVSHECDLDALEFRIGARFYTLFVGEPGAAYYGLRSIAVGPAEERDLEALNEAPLELETDDEGELLGYLAARMRGSSRLRAVQ